MLPLAETPLVRLGNLFPARKVYAKCEFLAPSGCFKIRGAVHLLEHLRREGRTPPLIVPSMGNTALGAAVGAQALGFKMTGVVPKFPDREQKAIEPAPDLGQHNREIYCGLLGLSDAELSALSEAEVI